MESATYYPGNSVDNARKCCDVLIVQFNLIIGCTIEVQVSETYKGRKHRVWEYELKIYRMNPPVGMTQRHLMTILIS